MEKCINILSATSTSQQVHMCSVLEQTRPQFCASATVRCNAQTTWTCVVCRSSHGHSIKLSATALPHCHMHMCIVLERIQPQPCATHNHMHTCVLCWKRYGHNIILSATALPHSHNQLQRTTTCTRVLYWSKYDHSIKLSAIALPHSHS